MNRRWGLALIGAILLTAPTWGQIDAGRAYHGPGLSYAGDVTYPMNSSTGIQTGPRTHAKLLTHASTRLPVAQAPTFPRDSGSNCD